MRTKRSTALVALLGALLWTGCAGSGSSGFDGPASFEDRAIVRALEEHGCVEQGGLEICSIDAPLVLHGGTIAVELSPAAALPCTATDGDASCRLALSFVAEGFAPQAAFRVVVRSPGESGPWTIGGEVRQTGEARPVPSYSGDVLVPLPESYAQTSPEPAATAQVAVLVFADAPASLPAQADTLGATGAELAVVSEALDLVVGETVSPPGD